MNLRNLRLRSIWEDVIIFLLLTSCLEGKVLRHSPFFQPQPSLIKWLIFTSWPFLI